MSADDWLHDNLKLDKQGALLVDSLTKREAQLLKERIESARALTTIDLDSTIDQLLSALPKVVRRQVLRLLQREGDAHDARP